VAVKQVVTKYWIHSGFYDIEDRWFVAETYSLRRALIKETSVQHFGIRWRKGNQEILAVVSMVEIEDIAVAVRLSVMTVNSLQNRCQYWII